MQSSSKIAYYYVADHRASMETVRQEIIARYNPSKKSRNIFGTTQMYESSKHSSVMNRWEEIFDIQITYKILTDVHFGICTVPAALSVAVNAVGEFHLVKQTSRYLLEKFPQGPRWLIKCAWFSGSVCLYFGSVVAPL